MIFPPPPQKKKKCRIESAKTGFFLWEGMGDEFECVGSPPNIDLNDQPPLIGMLRTLVSVEPMA